jgi:hypothetical protein
MLALGREGATPMVRMESGYSIKNNKFLKRLKKKFKRHGPCRVPEYEDYFLLSSEPYFVYKYAEIIGANKMPEPLHRKMLSFAIMNPNNYYVKRYLSQRS